MFKSNSIVYLLTVQTSGCVRQPGIAPKALNSMQHQADHVPGCSHRARHVHTQTLIEVQHLLVAMTFCAGWPACALQPGHSPRKDGGRQANFRSAGTIDDYCGRYRVVWSSLLLDCLVPVVSSIYLVSCALIVAPRCDA